MLFPYKKKKLLNKKRSAGATAIEYALVVSLIAVVCISGYRLLGNSYVKVYNCIAEVI